MKPQWPSKRGWTFAAVTGAVVVALPYLLRIAISDHGFWDRIPGWWAWFGALGCAVIVVFSKWLGKAFLSQDEDWYDR